MRLIRLYVARLCFKLSFCLAIADKNIIGLEFAPDPPFPLYHC
ncbi:hypothetical protein [Bradyrhizobium sp. RDM4]